MKIGELARKADVSPRMLRYYEAHGVLHPARSDAGYRIYDDADVKAVMQLKTLSQAGLPLDTIRPLLPCLQTSGTDRQPPCEALRKRIREKVAMIEQQINQLNRAQEVLSSLLSPSDSR